jgi:peptidoglycan/xylan/chitin deacetylase (PgdA/CDA1 family)/SAM-dependent methyltransferase/GT2 family glycosyltransferase
MSTVAIVVTCRDQGRTVEAAVDSALAQSRPVAEIVIVDHGSTDVFTRQVLARLVRPRTRVERIPGQIRAIGRNHGIRLTTAPYLVMLAAADRLEPRYLEHTAGRLDADPALGFVWTAVRGGETHRGAEARFRCDLATTLSSGPVPTSALLRRSLWDAIGGFDETLPTCEDLDFWISALERGVRGEVLDEPLLCRRGEAASPGPPGDASDEHLRALHAVLLKHRASIERLGVELLMAKEADLVEEREQLERLVEEHAALGSRLHAVRQEVERLSGGGTRRTPVEWGALRRLSPISAGWGLDRGRPIDRYYIEGFLDRHRSDVRGRVLEVKDAGYTIQFGGARVTGSDVLDIDAGNPRATIVTDLTAATDVPAEQFDCFILTQTLHVIYDVRAALSHARRLLKPGGVLLCTLPAVSRVSDEGGGLDHGDYWRFTEASTRALFAELFPPESFEVTPYGNVLACAAFLYGLATEELAPHELDHPDPWVPLLFAVRAVKPAVAADRPRGELGAGAGTGGPGGRATRSAGVILAYHQIVAGRAGSRPGAMDVETLRAHLKLLRERWQPLSLDELAEATVNGAIPAGAVAITFDDGYLSALELASPVLEELGLPATFFVGTERLDEAREWWWGTLERILASDDPLPTELTLPGIAGFERIRTASRAERDRCLELCLERVRSMSKEDQDLCVRALTEWAGRDLAPRPSHRVLGRDEIRRLAGRPEHTIGAHTEHHLMLPRQPLARRIQEIIACRRTLEAIIERPIEAFAYPFGAHDDTTVEIVRGLGFRVAVTATAGAVRPGHDVLRLPRCEPDQWSVERLATYIEALTAIGPA